MIEEFDIEASGVEEDWFGGGLTAAQTKYIRAWISHHPWKPGMQGKGIVTASGAPITWRTTDGDGDTDHYPYHSHAVQSLSLYGEPRAMLRIHPDGATSGYSSEWSGAKPSDKVVASIARIAGAWIDG